jgi:hypothetical protein
MIFDGCRGFLCKWMIIVMIAGVAIRMAISPLLTYNYDFYSWALIISNMQAGCGLYDVAGYNYPPVWGYFLGILAQFTDLFGIDVLAERFPELIYTESSTTFFPHSAYVTTLEFSVAITAMLTVFDVLISFVIYWFVKDTFGDEPKALACAAVWMLCPFVIVIVSVGGMFDGISGLMTLLCVMLLIKERELLAGMVFSAAVLLKLFPGFLLFIFLAYIIAKHRGNGPMKRVAMLIIGGILMTAVIMLPNVLSGHLMDSLSFITSRATTPSEDYGALMQIGPIVTYVAILILEIVLAVIFLRREHRDLDRSFLFATFVSAMLIFVYPSTPQYVLFVAPLLIMVAFCMDARYRIPLYLLMVGTTIFTLSSWSVDLTGLAAYTDLMTFDQLDALYAWSENRILGWNMSDITSIVGGTIQYIATSLALLTILKTLLMKKGESETDGLHQ